MPRSLKPNEPVRLRSPTSTPSSINALATTAAFGMLAGCQAIDGIFKAGFWVGALVVLALVALVVFASAKLVTREGLDSKPPHTRGGSPSRSW